MGVVWLVEKGQSWKHMKCIDMSIKTKELGCHLFIHYGRTNILAQTGRLDKKRFKKIIQDKMELLKEHDMIEEAMKTKLIPPIDNFGDDWTEWHIIIYGIKYYSKFKNRADWKNKYNATLI